MNLKTIQTKLETASREEISAILDDKAMTIGANQTADYISMAIENIETSKDRINKAIKELNEVKKSIEAQGEVIKVGASEWLTSNGIDKLNGDRISSISVFNKSETIEVVIDNEEAVINAGFFKMAVDKTAVKQALLDGANIEGAHIEITHNEQSIKINKKRVKKEETEG